MRTTLYLKFQDKQEAISVLGSNFYTTDNEGNQVPWDGIKTPFSIKRDTLVFVPNETIKLHEWNELDPNPYNEDGTPDLSSIVVEGFHVNLLLTEPYSGEYDSYKIVVSDPASKF